MKAARHAFRSGAHADALEKYLWFHHHALEHDRALRGVRLSYAISEWLDLGRVYPPALTALEAVQTESQLALQRGSTEWTTFNDFASVNEALDRFELTSQIFEEIAADRIKFARVCFPCAVKSLIHSGRYTLARSFVPHPKEPLDGRLANLASAINEGPPADFHKIVIDLYARELRLMMRIFEGVGEHKEAELFRSKAIG